MRSFAPSYVANLRKMSSNLKKSGLANKLSKKLRVEQVKTEEKPQTACPEIDIEDTVLPIIKSEFFSSTETPQRKLRSRSIRIREVTNTKRVKTEIKSEETKLKSVKNVKKELEDEKPIEQDIAVNIKPEVVRSIFDIEENEVQRLEGTVWEPENWRLLFHNIRQMRSNVAAPVDTMGCNSTQDKTTDDKTQRFHILVSLMLSSQTKDETTFAAMERLRSYTLTPETICDMDISLLEKLINPTSFYKTKAKHLKLTSRILIDQYNSDIPRSVSELIKLPGVGPKMAHLCMSEAWNEVTGIGVDVHVHRISNRLNWVQKPTKEPEKTRVSLESWLPRSLWREINFMLVGFGQTICTPTRPKCNMCLNRELCPSAGKINEVKKPTKAKIDTKKILI